MTVKLNDSQLVTVDWPHLHAVGGNQKLEMIPNIDQKLNLKV